MVDTSDIHNNCIVVVLYYFSVNSVICRAITLPFSSKQTSLGGITAMSLTLKRRKLIISFKTLMCKYHA